MSPSARRRAIADMGPRVDIIADTGWAAEGLAAALQRGAQAAVASGAVTPDAIIARPASLERWLAETPALPGHAPEVIVALLPEASFGARVLQRLPADTPVLWLHPASEGAMPIDTAPDRAIGRLPV